MNLETQTPKTKAAALVAFKIKRKRGSKGKQITVSTNATYAELDMKIRNAFNYDTWDHCSAFYAGQVWRSECLAQINPDGSGENQKAKIQDLTVPGTRISYVYDFGDDIQHDVIFDGLA